MSRPRIAFALGPLHEKNFRPLVAIAKDKSDRGIDPNIRCATLGDPPESLFYIFKTEQNSRVTFLEPQDLLFLRILPLRGLQQLLLRLDHQKQLPPTIRVRFSGDCLSLRANV